ncbi:MAG: outer membrane protein assembly factor BamE, partial [Motiliproteus sp.]
MKVMAHFRPLCYLLFLLVATACSSNYGSKLNDNSLSKIKVGQTTKQQMINWFGKPYSKSQISGGKVELIWYYHEVNNGVFSSDVKQQILTVVFSNNRTVEHY